MRRFVWLAAILGSACAFGQTAKNGLERKYTVIVTRHGVRSPTWTPERLNQYSSEPWPSWGVAPGYLTPHGRELMKIMGSYYRDALWADDAGGKPDCAKAGAYFWADTDQRTLETAKAVAEGMLPGCAAEVHSAPAGTHDPLFDPTESGLAKQDPQLGLAAVTGRIGPKLDALVEANRSAFDALVRVLNGGGKAPTSIFAQPMTLAAGESGVAMSGPLSLASTFTENLLLEYTDGMSGDRLGWGRLNASTLLEIMTLHTAYAELMRRTPYLARVRGSNLLSHVLRSMEQAVDGKPVKGALGKPGSSVLVISGHDTNLSNLSGMLGLSWLLPSYQRDDVPPGGALIFSLWRSAATGRYSVRVQFVAQTMDQMHNREPLSPRNPPAIANLFVPGCSTSSEGYACAWADFLRTARNALSPEFTAR